MAGASWARVVVGLGKQGRAGKEQQLVKPNLLTAKLLDIMGQVEAF
jgi:hypothetical protein